MLKQKQKDQKKKTGRILQVFSSLGKGGAESRMMDIYRSVDRNKVQFDFVVMNPVPEKQYFYSEIINMGGKVFEIQSWRKTGIFGYCKQWKNVMSRQYGCVHAHNGFGGGLVLFIAWLNRVPIRIAHARHSSPLIDTGPGWLLRILKVATNLFSNVKIYCSEEAANYLFFRRYRDKKATIFLPNAISMNSFCNTSSVKVKQLYDELKLQNYSYAIGTVGNARPVKNHIFLVKAFEKFLKLSPNSLLLIIGDDREDEEAKIYVKEHLLLSNVSFLGLRTDVAELLQLMDLFVLPSLSEGAPGCVIEAQAMNVPCVLSDTITRAVDAHTGLVKYVSLKATPDEWAKEMMRMAGMKRPDIAKIRTMLREQGYDVSTSAEKLLEIYGVR